MVRRKDKAMKRNADIGLFTAPPTLMNCMGYAKAGFSVPCPPISFMRTVAGYRFSLQQKTI